MESLLAQIFDPAPEPALFCKEGRVLYHNPAAARLWPELKEEGPLPEIVPDLLESTVCSLVLANRLWRSDARRVDDGILLRLRPETAVAVGPDAQKITGQLRRELSALHVALSRLSDPAKTVWTGKELERELSTIRRQFYRMLRMCGHLEAMDSPAEPGAIELRGFFRELGYQVDTVCRLNGWKFRYEDRSPGALWAVGDSRRLRLMALNLISNAMKTVASGGGLGMSLVRRGRQAMLTVWDGGEGMTDAELSRVFSQEDLPPSLSPEAGLGLGLDLARRVAEDHGGALMLLNQPGKGLRVTAALPLDSSAAAGATLHTPGAGFTGDLFGDVLIELSDVLPFTAYSYQDIED